MNIKYKNTNRDLFMMHISPSTHVHYIRKTLQVRAA